MTARVAASTYDVSGSWSPLKGVGTTMKYASHISGFPTAFSAPEAITSCSMDSRPGSMMWSLPALVLATTSGLTSTPVTCTPCLAAMMAVGRPMYPRPIKHAFILLFIKLKIHIESFPQTFMKRYSIVWCKSRGSVSIFKCHTSSFSLIRVHMPYCTTII